MYTLYWESRNLNYYVLLFISILLFYYLYYYFSLTAWKILLNFEIIIFFQIFQLYSVMVYFNFCSFGSTGWQSTAHQQPKPQPAEHQPADPRDDGSQRPYRLHHRQGRHQDRWDQVVFPNLLNNFCRLFTGVSSLLKFLC